MTVAGMANSTPPEFVERLLQEHMDKWPQRGPQTCALAFLRAVLNEMRTRPGCDLCMEMFDWAESDEEGE